MSARIAREQLFVFFSEHAMALFAIASAESFQAQRRNAPNAATVTLAGLLERGCSALLASTSDIIG
jgi:hypothetical protein